VQAFAARRISRACWPSAHDLATAALRLASRPSLARLRAWGPKLPCRLGDSPPGIGSLFAEGGARVLVSVSRRQRLPLSGQAMLASQAAEAERGQPAFARPNRSARCRDGRLQITPGGRGAAGRAAWNDTGRDY